MEEIKRLAIQLASIAFERGQVAADPLWKAKEVRALWREEQKAMRHLLEAINDRLK